MSLQVFQERGGFGGFISVCMMKCKYITYSLLHITVETNISLLYIYIYIYIYIYYIYIYIYIYIYNKTVHSIFRTCSTLYLHK